MLSKNSNCVMSAVHVNQISKVFRLYRKPVHRLWEALAGRSYHHPVKSLTNVSFDVPAGGTLGIIGENGAGKSTLLKILAGTLTPTGGTVQIKGRVSALLELGAGFHPEFTGRQNIYLNASLYGLSPAEIRQKETDIIQFADLGKFIDQPIKTYSSGMTVRLAFSIATSIDPDILIVDEALSVGDQHFQQKCVERMTGFQTAGKTLILCSHSMYLINELCRHSIWLEKGGIVKHDVSSRVISAYIAAQEARNIKPSLKEADIESSGARFPEVTVENVHFQDPQGCVIDQIHQFETLVVHITLRRRTDEPFEGHVAVILENDDAKSVFAALTKDRLPHPVSFEPEQTLALDLPSLPLQQGVYRARVLVSDAQALRVVHQQVSAPCLVQSEHPEYGMVWMAHNWKI